MGVNLQVDIAMDLGGGVGGVVLLLAIAAMARMCASRAWRSGCVCEWA